jgi:hypothetical protein
MVIPHLISFGGNLEAINCLWTSGRRYFCFFWRREGWSYPQVHIFLLNALWHHARLLCQVFCIFLFLCAASLFGTIIAQVNEIVAQMTTKKKDLDTILEAYLVLNPRFKIQLLVPIILDSLTFISSDHLFINGPEGCFSGWISLTTLCFSGWISTLYFKSGNGSGSSSWLIMRLSRFAPDILWLWWADRDLIFFFTLYF